MAEEVSVQQSTSVVSLAGRDLVSSSPAFTPSEGMDLDNLAIDFDLAIIQPVDSSKAVNSSSIPEPLEAARVLKVVEGVQAPIAKDTSSSPESVVMSKLASRIKLIDGTMEGVPKMLSCREVTV